MRYTFIKQFDSTDCAAACLAMVCLHYKKETTITKLRDVMGTDIKGTNLIGLSNAAEELGFYSQSVRVEKEGFLSEFTVPCIAKVITKEGMEHFVVVFKKNEKFVIIGDPAKDLVKVTLDAFLADFTGIILVLKPSNAFNKDRHKNRKMFDRFFQLLLPQKKLFCYLILTSVVLTVLGIVSSLFNKVLMDEILPYRLKDMLLIMVIVFALMNITQILIGFIRQWMTIYLSQKIDIPLLLGYFEHIYKLPMSFFAARKTGDIITRFSDAFTIKDIFTNIALTLIMDISLALVTGVVLFMMNSKLFVIILFLTIISIILVFIFKQPYKAINEEQMQQASILNSQIIEGLRAVETIKGNANEEHELERLEREYIKSLRISMKEGMLSNIQGSIASLVQGAGNLVLMYFGALQVINNDITLGSLMAFTTMSGYFMNPIGNLVGLQMQIQEATISMRRLAEILDYKQEQEEKEYQDIKDVAGTIEFNNVTFRYGNRNPVLKNLSFSIGKGEKVGIVGNSGSGKSTIAKLLLKYYEPESGAISIDGLNLSEISNNSLRKAIAYVPQNIELFSKSIMDNIRITKPNAALEEVKQAAIKAEAHDFIKKLPLQYHTFLEESGNGLSGGEKQRIVLARAFLKKANFYILDESTSNLDFATENLIFDVIYNKLRKQSMLIIAHRLTTIKECSRIIVLEDGEIIEEGTHDELLEKNGKYKILWDMQQYGYKVREELEEESPEQIEQLKDEDEISYT